MKKARTQKIDPGMTPVPHATLLCLILGLLSIMVFVEVGTHQFVFDDLDFIVHNRMVKSGLTWDGIAWAFTTRHLSIWHPVTWLSHMMDCQFFGLDPSGPHLINLLFHITNAVLLFLLFRFCTGAEWPSFLVASLFAVHPLHVESVAWVAERKDVLSAFFWMLTMWAYIWYLRTPGWKSYSLMLLIFCLGLMTKPMLVTLPLVLLLWDYWPLQRSLPQGAAAAGRVPLHRVRWRRLVWEKIPMFGLVFIFSLIAIFSQEHSTLSLADLPVTARISNALIAYASYLGKTVWPIHLAPFYPHPGNSIPASEAIAVALLLGLLSLLLIRKARSYPYLPMGWLWFLGTLVPVIGLWQVGSQGMADRYTYLPLIGIFIILAWGLRDLLAKRRCPGFLMPLISGVLIAACAACFWFQVGYWRNSISLWEHTLSVTKDNFPAHVNLGEALYFRGEINRALRHYEEAIRLNPPLGLIELAWVMATTKDPEFRNGAKAVELARKANRLTQYKNPRYLDVLAAAYAAAGKFSEAISTAYQALEMASLDGKADLAQDIEKRISLYQQGQVYCDEAYDAYQKS